MNNLRKRFCATQFYETLNFKDELAAGRCYILLAGILTTVIINLTSGVFLTGFLLASGLNSVEIGALGCIPFLTALFNLLSPFALGRYERRKKAICFSRLIYYFIGVFLMTFVPWVFHNRLVVVVMIALCMIVSNSVNALYSTGLFAWHVNFLPEKVRASYFTYQQVLNGIVSAMALVSSGWISDKMQNSGNSVMFFTGLRIVTFFICIVEVWLYYRPREFAVEKESGKTALLAIGTVFRDQREYSAVLIVVFFWNVTLYLPATATDIHVLQIVQVPYTLVTALNASIAVFLVLFAPFWKKCIQKCGWLKTFALATILYVPCCFAVGFVTKSNYRWLYTAARCAQQACYVGIVITYSNFPYLALRKENQTACSSAFSLINNLGSLTGQMLGTILLSYIVRFPIYLFGEFRETILPFVAIQGLGLCFLSVYSVWLHKYLDIHLPGYSSK